MKINLDALLHFEPTTPPRPILPTIALGLDEIFVTDTNFKDAPRLGEFMPVLKVSLVRRGSKFRPAAVFSLS